MSGTVADFLAEWRGLLGAGVHEQPKGSNHAPPVTDAFFDDKWCAMTASYCAKRVGFGWFHTARVVDIRAWAQSGKNGMTWHPAGAGVAGDLLIWEGPKGHHVNVVESRNDDGRYVHIGGNEQDAVRRAVWSSPTTNALAIVGVARLPFGAAPSTPVLVQGLEAHELGSRVLKVTSPLMKGTDIAFWQQLLHLKIDGSYGTNSEEGTKAFQRQAGLKDDGKVGPNTIAAMRRALQFVAATGQG